MARRIDESDSCEEVFLSSFPEGIARRFRPRAGCARTGLSTPLAMRRWAGVRNDTIRGWNERGGRGR